MMHGNTKLESNVLSISIFFFAHYGITVESMLLQLIQCLFTIYKLNSLFCTPRRMIDASGDGVSYYFMETAVLVAQKFCSDSRVSRFSG